MGAGDERTDTLTGLRAPCLGIVFGVGSLVLGVRGVIGLGLYPEGVAGADIDIAVFATSPRAGRPPLGRGRRVRAGVGVEGTVVGRRDLVALREDITA